MKPVTISETADKKYWIKKYEFEGMEAEAKAVALMPEGDIVIAGGIKPKEEEDAKPSGLVARLDREGNVKWVKILGGDKSDEFRDVKIAPNGDIIVAGSTNSFGAGWYDVWVLRLDEDGNIKWQKTYGSSDSEGSFAIAIAPNEDIIVAGSICRKNHDAYVLRLDSEGNVKWQKTYGSKGEDEAYAVAVAPNDDIIVAGYTTGDAWLLCLDGHGNVKWQKAYTREWIHSLANDVAITPNGDIIVVGEIQNNAWILLLDFKGNIKWQKTYGGKKINSASAVAINSRGDIFILGYRTNEDFEYTVPWILNIDINGNIKWQRIYGKSKFYSEMDIVANESSIVSVVGNKVLYLPSNGEIPGCKIIRNTKATITDTNIVVKNTNCKIKKAGGLFSKFKITNTNTTIRTAMPKVEVLCEWSPEKPAKGVKKPKPETGESLRSEVISTHEVETPSKTEKAKPAEEAKTVEGFPSALLERYEPLEFLSEGGFAKVFKARRKEDEKIVALKIPRIDEKTSGLFIKEVAAWYNLSHENIVRLYRADILPVPYLEMEFVEGIEVDGKLVRDLEKYPKPVDEKTALKLIMGIAKGLAHAHSKGIYHLDLKPLNVLLKADLTPKITDWGLAKISARSSLSRHYGYSPLYAAPEQLDEETFGMPDHRTDIYQLGLIFYELLTGELPYKATSPGALVGKILYAKPKPVSELKPELKKFDGIFEKLLAKRKEDRYQSVEEFLSALKSLGELEREKEELKKTSLAMRKSRSREEFERLKVESIRKTVKIAILSAKLNDKAELLAALDDLKFYTHENLDDLLNAIAQIEMLLKEGIPISAEVEERIKALVLRIENESSK